MTTPITLSGSVFADAFYKTSGKNLCQAASYHFTGKEYDLFYELAEKVFQSSPELTALYQGLNSFQKRAAQTLFISMDKSEKLKGQSMRRVLGLKGTWAWSSFRLACLYSSGNSIAPKTATLSLTKKEIKKALLLAKRVQPSFMEMAAEGKPGQPNRSLFDLAISPSVNLGSVPLPKKSKAHLSIFLGQLPNPTTGEYFLSFADDHNNQTKQHPLNFVRWEAKGLVLRLSAEIPTADFGLRTNRVLISYQPKNNNCSYLLVEYLMTMEVAAE